MKLHTKLFFTLLVFLLTLLTESDARLAASPAESDAGNRIQFHVAVIEENGQEKNTVASYLIAGPPGTDFDLDLHGERFRMQAKFLTDLTVENALQVRTQLETRRLYGYSERRLPLYEEDRQAHALRIGFDEEIVLLPFGEGGGDQRLKIEITPAMTEQSVRLASGKTRPLEINVLKVSPGGIINVQARKIPHRFVAEVVLLEDGREVARNAADVLFAEAQEIILHPTADASADVNNYPLAVRLTIDEYLRNRPTDNLGIRFDLQRLDRAQGDNREVVGSNWAGVAALDSALDYDLSNHFLSGSNKKYELQFRIKLADSETAN